ncbi:hypothetical protein GCM10010123_37120 [Pilimelia anulata]|uniref:M23ase beta-sheet core domain-containing protein n=1 Tax=Pilimelia anulata TaxID=53371 RepID=A0A8J3BE45_9ACTN|nr:M23 family metallopeptidase [Pilimelia anulata]GGK03777.1 hypothetical protein GCM10010123_37120 [Pilimelia anulata]
MTDAYRTRTAGLALAIGALLLVTATAPPAAADAEWTAPVRAPLTSGYHTPDRPEHHGVDIGATRGTPVRAVAAGTVAVARCQVTPVEHGCDRDGGLRIGGCGWYVDLAHPGGVITRYCHLGRQPTVAVGDPVPAGRVLGMVGSSGNSSGPHLHFAVHVDGDSTAKGSVDPVPFLRERGVDLAKPTRPADPPGR